MIAFYAISLALTVLVVLWLGRVLLRPAPGSGVSSERLNAAIYRDQLQALERDLAGGVISVVDFETTRDELQLRLLDETQDVTGGAPIHRVEFWTPRRMVVLISLLVPMGAAGLYAWLGTPSAVVRTPVANQGINNAQILNMVETLAERLKANPDNPKGWAMLARSYKVLGRLEEAEQAFLNAGEIINSDPGLLVDYADLLAARANSVDGRPLELVNKALQLDPLQPTGLMMSGVAAYHRGDFVAAIQQWEKLLTVLEAGSSDAQQVAADIALAKTKIDPTQAIKP